MDGKAQFLLCDMSLHEKSCHVVVLAQDEHH